MSEIGDLLQKRINEAKALEREAGYVANELADLLQGNLKRVSKYRLEKLKKELANYNMHTGRWK